MLKKMDKMLLITSIILFSIGLVMVFSASNVTSFMQYQASPYHFFNKQLIILCLSLAFSFVVLLFDTKRYKLFSWIAMIVFIALLVIVLLYGKITNQAKSWIELFGGVKLQPSEFIKVASIVFMASYIENIKKEENNIKKYLVLFGVLIGVTFLIVMQPDLGTAIIYVFILFLMFMTMNISKKVKRNILITIASVVVIVFLLLMNNGVQLFFERQMARFDFFDPCSEEKFYTTGTQVCNGFIAFNNGGLFGKGLGNSTQKYLYLPEAYTDFIFAIVVEELGLIPSIGILLLIFIVLWRIFIIGKKSNSAQNRMICYGIFWYILIHVVVNLGGITGIMPLTGVPLPFLSYGGSFLMCLVVSLAIVERISIENKMNE